MKLSSAVLLVEGLHVLERVTRWRLEDQSRLRPTEPSSDLSRRHIVLIGFDPTEHRLQMLHGETGGTVFAGPRIADGQPDGVTKGCELLHTSLLIPLIAA